MTFSTQARLPERQHTLVLPRSRIAPAVTCAMLAGMVLAALSIGIAQAQALGW